MSARSWRPRMEPFVCTGLIGLVVARTSHAVFRIPRVRAITIACILVSGPFFRYVAGDYFLSTLMSLPVLATASVLLAAFPPVVARPGFLAAMGTQRATTDGAVASCRTKAGIGWAGIGLLGAGPVKPDTTCALSPKDGQLDNRPVID